ncbi:MAG: hypothetical protein LRY55_07385 [Leadbetterella sp.]|nr:hypothetical protein [Leadbetterella sp.]
MKYPLLIALLFALSACQNAAGTDQVVKYFDSRTWVEGLIADLKKAQPLVEKTWAYDHKTEKKQVREIDWDKELKFFLDADLNKSSFIMSYDSVKEAYRTVYRLKPGENLPVKELSVDFDPARTPVQLQCIRQSENYFFSTSSEVSLYAEDGKLSAYEIRSVQKLLWFTPDSSVVTGRVIH